MFFVIEVDKDDHAPISGPVAGEDVLDGPAAGFSHSVAQDVEHSLQTHRVFGLERIERERRDLVDFEGLAWGGVLPSGGF